MCVGRLESIPIKKRDYDMEDLPVAGNVVGQLYPEIYNCIHCNACTRNCPQGIQVMKYIALAQRGDYAGCAKESFRCVCCNICAASCPAMISHGAVGHLARRLMGKYIAKKSKHLEQRVQAIEEGQFAADVRHLMEADDAELHRLYESRDIEK